MDKLHRALYEKLEEVERESQENLDALKYCHKKMDNLSDELNETGAELRKVIAERDGLYSDLDAMEKENIMLRTRVSELEEQNNPRFSADMDMSVDVPDGTCDIPTEG